MNTAPHSSTPELASLPALETLIACPYCDALLEVTPLAEDERAACVRCGTVLIAPRIYSFLHVIALSFTAMILMVGAVFFPFLKISASGLSHESSLFGAALAFSDGLLLPLAVALMASIVAVPVLRFAAIIYTLAPLANGRPPWRHAARTFRLAEELEPWAMAEIFVIGTAVALVKVAGLATVSFGAAFWALCALIIVTALKNSFLSEGAIWAELGANRAEIEGDA
ncbi:paraquat-inducible protein A [Albirhodobacter sp. R86504]|uniref:paraquat-inducible protein A n=1 Tax=Albirhodobacter sp. R86504 TaxID=3093848 RepID=UPI00367297AE